MCKRIIFLDEHHEKPVKTVSLICLNFHGLCSMFLSDNYHSKHYDARGDLMKICWISSALFAWIMEPLDFVLSNFVGTVKRGGARGPMAGLLQPSYFCHRCCCCPCLTDVSPGMLLAFGPPSTAAYASASAYFSAMLLLMP